MRASVFPAQFRCHPYWCRGAEALRADETSLPFPDMKKPAGWRAWSDFREPDYSELELLAADELALLELLLCVMLTLSNVEVMVPVAVPETPNRPT